METLVKLKSLAKTPGCTIVDWPKAARFLTGSVNPSTLLSSSRRLWLNRRFLTGRLTSPFSTRNVPSLVMPVRVLLLGSTSRTYQNLVSNSPLSSSPISCSVVLVVPRPLITKLVGSSPSGLGNGNSWPVGLASVYFRAEIREEARFRSVPSSTSVSLLLG